MTIKLEQNEKKELKSQLAEKESKINSLQKQVYSYQKTNLEVLLTKKDQELTETKKDIVTSNQEELDNMLELQIEIIANDSHLPKNNYKKPKKD